jgi:hypothetical protein
MIQRVHPIGRGKANFKLYNVEGFGGFLGLCCFVGFGFEGLWVLGWGVWVFGFSRFGAFCVYCLCIQARLSLLINYYSSKYIFFFYK